MVSIVTGSRNMGEEPILASGIQGRPAGREVMFELSQKLEVAKGGIRKR